MSRQPLACAAALLLAIGGAGPVAAEDDAAAAERLAKIHCGRCHVVSAAGGLGGIGSTPSFAALRSMSDWEDRFEAFWTLPPHPSFTQIAGVTPPFPEDRPATIAPIELTLDEVEAIVGYAERIEPADLGAPVR